MITRDKENHKPILNISETFIKNLNFRNPYISTTAYIRDRINKMNKAGSYIALVYEEDIVRTLEYVFGCTK